MSEKDAGFCSGEDDLDVDDIHSPTDASEDSIEVKVTAISPRNKNKRKCAEPRKVPLINSKNGPLKKRIRRDLSIETSVPNIKSEQTSPNPFRPWSSQSSNNSNNYHPVFGYQPPTEIQDEPLSLVKIEKPDLEPGIAKIKLKEFAKFPPDEYRVPPHPGVLQPSERMFNVDLLKPNDPAPSTSSSHAKLPSKEHRNYKNMTRERRIEANARERTRVHTISAAFDTLRKAIPSYSHNQKLSKLSVLRIACSYILTLSRVAGSDYSADESSPPLANCVDLVTRTIQTEGKFKKKKDE